LIIVILAAGSGNRLKKTLPKYFPYETKSLIPINNQPAIKRLIKQFFKINQNDILVVLGHKYESVMKELNNLNLEFVLNNSYKNDSNLRSLFIAVKKIINNKIFDITNGILVVEADSYFSDEILKSFIDHIQKLNKNDHFNRICWTTKGSASLQDSGGFVEIFKNSYEKNNGQVKKAYISKSPNNTESMKMYGITWFNYKSIIDWYEQTKVLLNRKNSNDSTGYFHEILFNNSLNYTMSYYDFGNKSLSFNNYDEYMRCLNLD
tara:strand:- start:628 stop:1416 length:789 start_codon:yes stop_codon:yes gene_type:complete